jgi:hypothetical protein
MQNSFENTPLNNLITTKTIPNTEDVFWNDLPEKWKNLDSKRVLIICSAFTTSSNEETTLLKMLNACSLTQEQYHILQFDEESIAFHKIKAHFEPEVILLLGIVPEQLGIHSLFRLNYPNGFGGCVIIPGLSLQAMEQNTQAKKDLWLHALKPYFTPNS